MTPRDDNVVVLAERRLAMQARKARTVEMRGQYDERMLGAFRLAYAEALCAAPIAGEALPPAVSSSVRRRATVRRANLDDVFGPTLDRAWASVHAFRAAHAVLSRYRSVDDLNPDKLEAILSEMTAVVGRTALREQDRDPFLGIEVFSEEVSERLKGQPSWIAALWPRKNS
jgi:hypothetical protein